MLIEASDEFEQWQPSLSEIAELLHHLQLSPPHSDEELISQPDNSTSSRNDQSESDESSYTTSLEKFDRAEILEQFEHIIKEKGINRMKNNWFHEHLVEHFTRKQMIHVCSDKCEDQGTLDEYLHKLKLMDKQNIKTLSSEDRWNKELRVIHMEIAEEEKNAGDIVQSIISVEREIRIHTAPRVKQQLALRKIEKLILKQTGRINKVSHFRLSYLKIRNRLILIENNLHSIISSGPNLSKDDYERLEAEQHYYKQQLNAKTNHHIDLINRKDYSAHRLEMFNLKILHIKNRIEYERRRIFYLRKMMKHYLDYDRVMRNKINKNNKMIRNYRTEIHHFNVEKTYKNYDEWIEKIAMILKQIKCLSQSLSALKTNLILHGRNIELATNNDIEIVDKIVG